MGTVKLTEAEKQKQELEETVETALAKCAGYADLFLTELAELGYQVVSSAALQSGEDK